MNRKEFKNRFLRVVRNTRKYRFVFDFKKKKQVVDKSSAVFYLCECGCEIFGNFDLFLVHGIPMSLDCGLKFLAKDPSPKV